MKIAFKFLAFCLICSGFGIARANCPNDDVLHLQKSSKIEQLKASLDEIDLIAADALKIFKVPGIAVGLVYDGHTVLSRGYGFRNVDQKLPVTEHTLFPIASCTKAFTALMLGQLVDEGKISWDDPVKKHIPEFCLLDPEMTHEITIRDVLAHRTGMARHDPIWIFSEICRSDVIELLKHLEPACGLRQEFQYNNFMYSLAGILIERVTGQVWEKEVADRILTPLEMKDSNVDIEVLQSSLDHSLPYADIEGKVTTLSFRNASVVNPGGGINSTIADITKWVELHLFHGKIHNKSFVELHTLNELHKVQMPLSQSPNEKEEIHSLGYGLGWIIGKYQGIDIIRHGGDIDGFCSEVAFLPDEGIGIVIFTNNGSSGRYLIPCLRNQIIDRLLEMQSTDWTQKYQAIHSQVKLNLQKALQTYNAYRLSTNFLLPLQNYVGYYEHPAYGLVHIEIENDHLIATYGRVTIPLYSKNKDVFIGKFDELLAYGINPIVNFTFLNNDLDVVNGLEIPFEGFRAAKPIIFIKTE